MTKIKLIAYVDLLGFQRNRRKRIYIICYRKVAHAVTEAQKSKDLQRASWRPGEPLAFQARACSPESQESQWCKIQSGSKGKRDRCPSSTPSDSESNSLSLSSPSLDKALPHCGGQFAWLRLPIQMLFSGRNIPTGTPRIIFNQISGHLVTQSSWHPINHHSR